MTASGRLTYPRLRLAPAKRIEARNLVVGFASLRLDLGDTLIQARDRLIGLLAARDTVEESADLFHLGHPAIGFRRHLRHLTRQPGEQLRLAVGELLVQRV